MAIYRNPEHCFFCGVRLEPMYRNMGKHFVGDTFIGYKAHKCDETTEKYKQYEAEIKTYQESPEGKANAAKMREALDELSAKRKRLAAKEQVEQKAKTTQTDMDMFNDYLREVANVPSTNIRRKILSIKKFAEGLAAKNAKKI
jgi:hypothetical protein